MADFDDFDNDGFDSSPEDDRQNQIEAFEQEVTRNSKILLSRKADANARVAAAHWLGESGVPQSITALRKVYRGESNPKVKSAAEYALGQFKALYESVEKGPGESFQDALGNPQNQDILQRLEAIALEGKMSKPSRFSGPALRRLQMILGGLLAVLVIVNLVLLVAGGDDGPPEIEPVQRANLELAPEDAEVANTVNSLYTALDSLSLNSRTLQAQFNGAASGGELACDLIIIEPAPVTVPASLQGTHPNLGVLARRLEASGQGLSDAHTIFTTACDSGQPPSQDQTTTALAALEGALGEVSSIEEGIDNVAQAAIATATEKSRPTSTPITPTDEPTETPTSTPSPTPTLEPEDIDIHVRQMEFRLDQVTASRGAIDLLSAFWSDAASAGRTDGCREARPAIPDDYTTVIPAEVLNAAPELARAQQNLNLGLSLLRQGWDLFQASCSSGSLSSNAQIGNDTAEAATSAITESVLALDALSQSRAEQEAQAATQAAADAQITPAASS